MDTIEHEHSEAAMRAICDRARVFSQANTVLVRTAFATGSYVAGHWNRARPSLNVYFIAHDGRAADLRLTLAALWDELKDALAQDGWEMLIDCHPYTVSCRAPVPAPRLITVTTKVLEHEFASSRYRLPPTIGPGWCRALRILHGEREDVMMLAAHPHRDGEWARTLHRALSHYRGVLDHVVWALPWRARPQLLVEESARYAEEALKDALSLGLSGDELAAGRHMELLEDWATAAQEFVADRFGPAGEQAARDVAALKQSRSTEATVEQAQECWRSALSVWDWAWSRYVLVAGELLPGQPDYLRVDAFV